MSFDTTHLLFEETGLFPKVMTDYIKGEPYLSPFYLYKPKLSEFKKTIKDIEHKPIDRKLIAKVLSEQYAKNAPDASETVLKNIKNLENKNCFTVTTGHQLCLFTGPLYFIYKIVSTINLAQRLRQEYPEYDFVPVYWMASEDHDFAEVNHAYLYGKKVEYSLLPPDAGGPVGHISTKFIEPALTNLFAVIGATVEAEELKNILTEAYIKQPTLAAATFCFTDKLFGRYGLVVADADNAELKKSFVPVLADELRNETSYNYINETNKQLTAAGVEPQVSVRNINLFYINNNSRNRIEKQKDTYMIIGTDISFTLAEITAMLKQSPEKFSPNVVLRPVYQQSILPNIAYIGGPSEIAYWLQLKAVFAHYSIAFPVLMPRNSAMLIDKHTQTRMDKLGVVAKDMFCSADEMIKKYITQANPAAVSFENEKKELNKLYEAITKKVSAIDTTLAALPQAELQKQYNALKTIETKLIRSQKQKDETSINQLRKLKEKLFPDGILQERHDNFIPFYLSYGGPVFLDTLFKNFNPLDYRMVVITEKE